MRTSVLLAASFLGTALVTAPTTARADGSDVSITSTESVEWWETVETQVDWCTSTARAGDRLTVALPDELTGFKPDFSVEGADGEPLATATVEGRTLVLRLDQTLGSGTCASARLESTLAVGQSAADSDIDARFEADGEVIENRIHVREWDEDEREEANAWGEWRDKDDQCRTDGDSCLLWHWDSPEGPLTGGVISGRPAEGQTYACDEVQVDLVELGEHGQVTGSVAWSARISCDPDELRVQLDAVPAGAMARVNVPVTVAPVADGGIAYETEFVASDRKRTSIAAESITSTTATLATSAAPGGEAPVRPDQLQGVWPFLTIGGLVVVAVGALLVRRRRAAR